MRALLASSLALVTACVPPPPAVPAHPDVARYDDPGAWLCLPGRDDACASDLTATELHADGTRTIERREATRAPKADCFYVYPTVDMGLIPGNHADLSDLAPMSGVTIAQAARFRETCALYVPLYRQVTIGSYLHEDTLEARLAFAYSDVEAAFREYLAKYDRGRPIVLIGHSQGAEMILRVVREFFDGDPVMRARLVLAMPIGAEVEVPRGATVGGTFAHVPMCTKPDEQGCVVAYRSHAAGDAIKPGRSAPRAGNESVCVNPAELDGGAPRAFSGAYFPVNDRTRNHLRGVDGVTTPFVVLRDFYSGRCEEGPDGYRYLAISLVHAAGDTRVNPIDFDRMPLRKQIGLHLVDFQMPQGDLVEMVRRRVK